MDQELADSWQIDLDLGLKLLFLNKKGVFNILFYFPSFFVNENIFVKKKLGNGSS